jgi:hypothetical protein
MQFLASSLVVGLPPPAMGEGWGGGGALGRQDARPLPPIPAFPHTGGKGPNNPDKPGEKQALNDPTGGDAPSRQRTFGATHHRSRVAWVWWLQQRVEVSALHYLYGTMADISVYRGMDTDENVTF